MRTPAILLVFALAVTNTATADAQPASQNTATGTSNTFNPALSLNGLFLGFHTSAPFSLEPAFDHDNELEEQTEADVEHAHEEGHAHGLPDESGLSVQEIEIRLSANVDAYLRAEATLAIPGTKGLELEEGYIESIDLRNITLRAGKFLSTFGVQNSLHTHAYPFIDNAIANERLLGNEGMNEVGIRASLLLPTAWFSELNLELLDGANELFAATDSGNFAYIADWHNLWDLNEDTTLEIGGSYGAGTNGSGELTQLIGSNLALKWRSSKRGSHRRLSLQTEYLQARVSDSTDTEEAGGLSAHAQLQMSRRWWLQGRYDLFGIPGSTALRQRRYSALVAMVLSEYSAFRAQYNQCRERGVTTHQMTVQINFTIGSHPAHAY